MLTNQDGRRAAHSENKENWDEQLDERFRQFETELKRLHMRANELLGRNDLPTLADVTLQRLGAALDRSRRIGESASVLSKRRVPITQKILDEIENASVARLEAAAEYQAIIMAMGEPGKLYRRRAAEFFGQALVLRSRRDIHRL